MSQIDLCSEGIEPSSLAVIRPILQDVIESWKPPVRTLCARPHHGPKEVFEFLAEDIGELVDAWFLRVSRAGLLIAVHEVFLESDEEFASHFAGQLVPGPGRELQPVTKRATIAASPGDLPMP